MYEMNQNQWTHGNVVGTLKWGSVKNNNNKNNRAVERSLLWGIELWEKKKTQNKTKQNNVIW